MQSLYPEIYCCKKLDQVQFSNNHELEFHEHLIPQREHKRRYNCPGDNELCLVVNDIDFGYPPVVVHHRTEQENRNGNERLQIIHDCNALYDMLHFVILFPNGGQGWHPNLSQRNDDSKKISLLQYYQYLLNERCNQTNSIMKGRKLLQQYVVMAWTRIESQKLRYF